MTRPARELSTYAHSYTSELLEVIPLIEALDCDIAAISIAFMRHCRGNAAPGGHFDVRGVPYPASNFSSNILVLTPLVKEVDGKRTLRPVADYIRQHGITDIRIVGSGNWERIHQYSRNGGATWGRMPVSSSAPRPPAPVQHLDAEIPVPPTDVTEDDLEALNAD